MKIKRVHLPDTMARQLDRLSKKLHISISEIIQNALTEYLDTLIESLNEEE
jgi:metal-responsive CopG/Arc/MetJ family transcriptional regulator